MGKNISVYLNDELLSLVESGGQSASQIVQKALKRYFEPENRANAAKAVIDQAGVIGRSERFNETILEWQNDRKKDRW